MKRVQLRSAAVAGLLWCAGSAMEAAWACGGNPPPPRCGKTLVLGQGLGSTTLLTGGGAMSIPVEAFFDAVEVGGGISCPPSPYFLTVTATLTCPITGVSTNAVTLMVNPGFTPVPIGVNVPAGPARVCALMVTGTVLFVDGTTISASGLTKDVCIVEPAPGLPGVSRLAVLHAGPPVVRVHPGDQARLSYILRNNDPTESFTGTFTADSEGSARLVTGPNGPFGVGPFTVSDPVSGDNFPLQFGPIAPPGCVPLPPDPGNPLVPVIAQALTLAPGESRVVEVNVRPWGMCANGSCSKSRVRLEGQFSGGTAGLACTSSAVFVDTSAPPAYLCEDGGAVAQCAPPTEPLGVSWVVRPAEQYTAHVRTRMSFFDVFVNGLPATGQTQSLCPRPDHGRLASQVQFPPVALDSFFDVFAEFTLESEQAVVNTELLGMSLVPGLPHGFSHLYPMAMGTGRVTSFGVGPTPVDSFFDIFYQVRLDGMDLEMQHVPMAVEKINVQPLGNDRWRVNLRARAENGSPTDGPALPLVGLLISQDIRGFARPSRFLFCPGDTNGDAQVNFIDLNRILSEFGLIAPGLAGDIDGDGDVDFSDLNFVLSAFGRNCGP